MTERWNGRSGYIDAPELWKWMGLAAAIWVQAFAGNSGAYANYASALKSVLGLSQVQLNYIALFKDLGANVGVLAGLLCNKLPPWVILSIGAIEGFLGFGSLWLVVSRTIQPRPLWQMCIAIFVGGNSMTWFNTAVLVTCMRNFPKSRGTIVGFLKGFIGLSGAFFTQIYVSLLGRDASRLLFFLAVGPTVLCMLSMGFIRPVGPSPAGASYNELEQEQKQFRIIYIICIVLAIYLFGAVFVDQFVANSVVSLIVVILMFIFLLAPGFVPIKMLVRALWAPKRSDHLNIESPAEPLNRPLEKPMVDNRKERASSTEEKPGKRRSTKGLDMQEEDTDILLALGEGAVYKRKKRRPRRGEDFKLKQALIKADFWLIFLTYFCGVSSSVVANNNLSQLGAAQGYTDVSIFILLGGIWGFLGRLGGGFVSEHFIRSAAMPRTVWIGAVQGLMIVAHLFYAFAPPGSLYYASPMLGFGFGMQIAVTVPTISEIFGLKHFGILYNFITLADPIGSLLLSTLLAGNLYDREVIRQYGNVTSEGGASDLVCTGAHCFMLTFLIMAGVCVVGVAVSIILTIRLRPVYVTLYGITDSATAVSTSYSSLPSEDSYSSLPSASASSSSLPPATFTFPRVSSSSSISQEGDPELR